MHTCPRCGEDYHTYHMCGFVTTRDLQLLAVQQMLKGFKG